MENCEKYRGLDCWAERIMYIRMVGVALDRKPAMKCHDASTALYA
jgi:hypothetical protein